MLCSAVFIFLHDLPLEFKSAVVNENTYKERLTLDEDISKKLPPVANVEFSIS